jgi:hypothetical protein
MRVAVEASAAEKHLVGLRNALSELPPQYGELLVANLESVAKTAVSLVTKQVPWFHALSAVAGMARAIARAPKGADRGGAPKTLAFRVLVLGLIPAFERVTGRSARVTWNPVESQYQGDFVHLVEALVGLVISFETAKRPMHIPNTAYARGSYIHKMTRSPRPRKGNI